VFNLKGGACFFDGMIIFNFRLKKKKEMELSFAEARREVRNFSSWKGGLGGKVTCLERGFLNFSFIVGES